MARKANDLPPEPFALGAAQLPIRPLRPGNSSLQRYELLESPAALLDPVHYDVSQLVDEELQLEQESEDVPQRIQVDRPAFTHEDYENMRDVESSKMHFWQRCNWWLKNLASSFKGDRSEAKRRVVSFFPVYDFVRTYPYKEWLLPDVIAGLTVGVFNVPQSLGHTLLVHLPLVYGLYASFIPMLLYFVFGVSRHAQYGTLSVTCLLVGNIVARRTSDIVPPDVLAVYEGSLGGNASMTKAEATDYVTKTQIDIAIATTFMMGIIQVGIGLFRLSKLTIFFADPMVAGYTTGTVLYIFTSQLKYAFGLNFPRPVGFFNLFMTWYMVLRNIAEANVATTIVTVITVVVLVICKFVVSPRVYKKIRVPLPSELLVIIVGTVASYYLQLHEKYAVEVMGPVKNGLPLPAVPNMSVVGAVAVDSVVPSLINYGVGVALAQVLAKKYAYEVDDSQEAFAYGLSNFFSSFFLCYPTGHSTARTCVALSLGTKSQLVVLLVSLVALITIVAAVELFTPLPLCILACVIMVGVTSMIDQFKNFWRLLKLSKFDAAIWMATFIPTVILDVDVGLLLGVIGSFSIVMVRTLLTPTCLLGNVSNTEIYENLKKYKHAVEIPKVKIYRYAGPIIFSNASSFRKSLYLKSETNPRHILHELRLDKIKRQRYEAKITLATDSVKLKKYQEFLKTAETKVDLKYVIIELSACAYVDCSALRVMKQIVMEYATVGVGVLFAGCTRSVASSLNKNGIYDSKGSCIVFTFVQDAVAIAKQRMAIVAPTFDEPPKVTLKPAAVARTDEDEAGS